MESTSPTETGPAVHPLVAQVLSGAKPRLVHLAAQGILPLPQDELINLQVQLTTHEDESVAEAASTSLAGVDALSMQGFFRKDASIGTVSWFARNSKDPTLLEILIQRRDFPVELAAEIAPTLSEAMQEILLLRQDLIVENPELLDAIEENPSLSSFAVRRVAEYRRHLVRVDDPLESKEQVAPDADGDAPAEVEAAGEGDDSVVAEVAAALAAAGTPMEQADIEAAIASDVEEGEEAELDVASLTEAQIKALPPPLRQKLARGAGRSLRGILLRDPNPNVAVAVLGASAVTESEIEKVSASRTVCEEVLMKISQNREWIRKYSVMHNLVRNPRTPIPIAMRQIPRLSMRDLTQLTRDRNVADAVRKQAKRLATAKRG